MSPNSKLMIHEVATASEGKSSDIISDALETQKLNDELMDILAQNAGKPKSFFKNLIKKNNNADFFLSAEQCKDYGLVDHVGIPRLVMDVKVNWDIQNIAATKPKSKTVAPTSKLLKKPSGQKS
jgi:ATP-dependent protease ClpP protease subunit